jgi:predicted nucleic acid-binding protein
LIVVDASAAVSGLLDVGEARRILSEEAFAAPHLIDAEIANALRGLVRRGIIEAADGWRAIERWATPGIERISVTPLLSRMWDLRDNLSGYDAAHVALAEALAVTLVTVDGRLSNAPGVRCDIVVLDG